MTFQVIVLAQDNEKTAIALIHPYSYKECQFFVNYVENKYKNDKDIYFNRNTLIHSPEGRKIDLITISSFDSIKGENEPYINHLYPLRN